MKYVFSSAAAPYGAEVFFDDGVDIERIAIAGVLRVLVMWLLFVAVKAFIANTAIGRRIFAEVNADQRESFVMWVVELIVTTWALGIIAADGFTLVHGSFNTSFHRDEPDTDWSEQPGYFKHVRVVMSMWAWAGQPGPVPLSLRDLLRLRPPRLAVLAPSPHLPPPHRHRDAVLLHEGLHDDAPCGWR